MTNINQDIVYVQCSRCLKNYESVYDLKQGYDISSSIVIQNDKVLIEYSYGSSHFDYEQHIFIDSYKYV